MRKQTTFVAIGALRVNTLTKNANCQSSLGYRNETVLRRKMGYFRKSCPTNHDKILNFVRLKMEVPIYNGTFCSFMLKVCCFVAIGALRVNTLTKISTWL